MNPLAALLLALVSTHLAAMTLRVPGVSHFELPPALRLETIGEELRVNGVPTRIWAFGSSQTPAELAAHFERQWPGELRRHRMPPWELLSRREGEWLLTVQLRALPGRAGCSGFIAVARAFAPAARRARSDLPLLPRTELLHDIEAEDLGRRSRTRILVSEQSAAQNLDFYRAHFRGQGYAPLGANALTRSARGGAMVLNRGAGQLDLSAAEHGGHTLIAIVQVPP